MKDHRSVALEALRDFVRAEVERTSIRELAARIGIGRTTLHSFVGEETTPHPRVRRLLGLWYLKWIEIADEIDAVRPYTGALETLVAGVSDVERAATVGRVLAEVAAGYAAGENPPPRWLDLLRRGHWPDP